MAKGNANSGSATVLEEEAAGFSRPPAFPGSGARSDARSSRAARVPVDPEDEADERFLRARRRVPIRRGLLPAWARTGWGKLIFAVGLLTALTVTIALAVATRSFLDHDPRFRIDTSASVQTLGNSQLTRADLLSVFGSDIGRNLFFVPLSKRRAALEQIPWVQQATVMRLLPNQLRVAIRERTPIAFVQVHGRIDLADIDGVILTMTPQQMAARHYSFPVVSGIIPTDPLSVRSARMHMYQRFMVDLDSTGEHISAQLSEVDLSDPDDVRATVPANGSDLLLHFGQEDFLARWHNYQAHIAQWQQQYPKLAAIDLRYDREVVLKMAGDPGVAPGASPAASPATSPEPAPKPMQPAPSVHTAPAQHHPAHKPVPAKHKPPAKAHASPKVHAKRGAA
ncbi:MAG: FtsQ-type POTRA domain-containing protein [Acidobacteriaceae bacterium]